MHHCGRYIFVELLSDMHQRRWAGAGGVPRLHAVILVTNCPASDNRRMWLQRLTLTRTPRTAHCGRGPRAGSTSQHCSFIHSKL